MVRPLGLVLLVALMAPACGDGDDDAGRTEELVAVTAKWQCDRQRFAFDSLDDLDSLLDDTLTAAGVSTAEYEAFQLELEADGDLRRRVLAEYEGTCGQ